jgi:hypothetical protein
MGKIVYSWVIRRDSKIPGTVVRSSTIPEQLGRISYLLTDKTGEGFLGLHRILVSRDCGLSLWRWERGMVLLLSCPPRWTRSGRVGHGISPFCRTSYVQDTVLHAY